MTADAVVHAEDLVPVRSRVSWGAVAAGSVLALSLYFLLALLGGAIGLSVGDKVSAQSLGNVAAVYAIVVTALCLFLGGYVASQLTTGENKIEGALFGIFVWATVFAMLMWLMASGVKVGFNAMVGVATAGAAAADTTARNTTQADWEAVAMRAGVPAGRIEEWKQQARNAPADARAAADDPATKAKAEQAAREAGEAATRVTWYAFLGAWVSMMAAAAGGYVGSGPTLQLFAVADHSTGRPAGRGPGVTVTG